MPSGTTRLVRCCFGAGAARERWREVREAGPAVRRPRGLPMASHRRCLDTRPPIRDRREASLSLDGLLLLPLLLPAHPPRRRDSPWDGPGGRHHVPALRCVALRCWGGVVIVSRRRTSSIARRHQALPTARLPASPPRLHIGAHERKSTTRGLQTPRGQLLLACPAGAPVCSIGALRALATYPPHDMAFSCALRV